MKKHENAIKALMKNVKDNEKWYGYFEDENGARYLMNTHIVIKLTGSTLDYVGELPRLNDTNFLNKLVDFVEAHKNGDYKMQLHMSNVKMWDKYNNTDNCYKLEYDKNKYIGFSADYMKRLYTLTGDNCITIIDSKSPIYIAGADIECVLLPVMLDKNYNSDNYALFLEELKACYIQDVKTKEENEKKKALKNTDKIGKDVIYNGFTMWIGGKQYFLMSDKKRVTDEITKDFLKLIAANTTINVDKISESDFKYIKNGINSATITKTASYYGTEEIYRIETKYNSENFYKNEYDKLIIYNGNMEKIDIYADDMSATDTDAIETKTADNMSATATDTAATTDTANNDSVTDTQGIKSANNADTTQDTTNNAITTETMQADARQETKQTDTTQDTPHKTSKKAISLFVVTDKPQPVKLPHLKPLNNIPMFQERFKTDFKPLKNNKGYNTRVKELKPLKKAYNDFVGTVSCYNDKYAISGGMVAVNSS